MKKPKKIIKKVRNKMVQVKSLHKDIDEAVDAMKDAIDVGESDQLTNRLEQIEIDMKELKKLTQYIDTRLWLKVDKSIDECVGVATNLSDNGLVIMKKHLNA